MQGAPGIFVDFLDKAHSVPVINASLLRRNGLRHSSSGLKAL